MPTYEIEQYEIHIQTYRVEAESEAQAVKRLLDGQAEPVDGSLEFIEIAQDLGLPAEEYQDLADELRSLGEVVNDVIPSVRDVQQIE